MTTTTTIRILITALLVLLMAGSAMGAIGTATTVCGCGCDYTTIQDAIDNATTGEYIEVGDGVYTENVIVDKTLTIRSKNGSSQTKIFASDPSTHTVNIAADGVMISGFTLTGATGIGCAGIRVENPANSAQVTHSCISDNTIGVYIYGSRYNNISCNLIQNNTAQGIKLYAYVHGSNDFHFNDILRNGIPRADGSYQSQVWNANGGQANMQNNYWGSVDEPVIQSSIRACGPNGGIDFVPFEHNSIGPCNPLPELSTIMLMFIGIIGFTGLTRYKSGD